METSRRSFLKQMTTIGLCTTAYPIITSFNGDTKLDYLKEKISKIELFRYDIDIPRHFSFGTWYNRQHLFMKISSGDYYGWAEIPASRNNPDLDPSEWVDYLSTFIGLSIGQSYDLLNSQQVMGTTVHTRKLEFIEMGLLDLSGRLQNIPAIELLGLKHNNPVPGLYCILDNDVEKVRLEVLDSIEQNLSHHLKFKMYGDHQADLKLLKAIREIIGENAVVISDANMGYKNFASLSDLAGILNEFKYNGLNAIEDPAEITIEEWIKLQEMVGELSLIPDVPLRPAWNGLNTIRPGMGRIFNLHPSVMGSFRHTALLVKKVNEIGCKVMIGDDSLVGPGCSAWQQIAVGAGAVWVEALEKKEDSKNYMKGLISSPTKLTDNGYVSYNSRPGFGIELDTQYFKQTSKLYIDLQ